VVLAVGGVAVAAVVADDEDDAVVVAAEASDVPTTLELPTTTTEITVPTTVTLPVTVPPVTLPRLRARTPAPTVPAAPAVPVTTVPPAPKPQGGARCGTPSGYAGLGADRTATTGRITLTLTVYSCEVYDGEILQNFVYVDDKGSLLRSARIEYGDGSVDDKSPYPWQCQDPNRPHPYVVNGPPHNYAAPGAYEVTATVTTATCDGWEGGQPAYVEQTATVRMTVYRIAGKRPT
jgi:hypothetical protein